MSGAAAGELLCTFLCATLLFVNLIEAKISSLVNV